MSIASPQNREEFRENIKMRLGAPVLQINVSDEQMDIAINDAFQYFYERQHFDATERVYLGVKVEKPFLNFLKTGQLDIVEQNPNIQSRSSIGMAASVEVISPGTGYKNTTGQGSPLTDVPTKPDNSDDGEGLTLIVDNARTPDGGIISVQIYNVGSGYKPGDRVFVSGGNGDAVVRITEIKNENSLYGVEVFKRNNNYIVLPEDVIGVNRIMSTKEYGGIGATMLGLGYSVPMITGGVMGEQYGGGSFGLVDYYAMQQHLSTLRWMIQPPMSYSFNKRTHRLFINSENFHSVGVDSYIVLECDVKANPDMFPDVWNDMFMKELSTAYVQLAWGRVLTKYQQVQLPGGINMNGDQILNDAKEMIGDIKERFSMDYMDPPLDLVG